MRISIWRQFSSNNSSDFTVVGVFETPEATQRAANEVRQMVETVRTWWNEHPDAEGEYDVETPTPTETEFGQRFGFTWPGALEWHQHAKIEVVLNRLVYITTENYRPDSAGEPFDKVLTALGGQGLIHGNFYGDQIGTILVEINCEAPDEQMAQAIADEKLAYQCMVRYEGRKLHFYDWPFSEFDLPSMISELQARGCTAIEYKLSASENPLGKQTDPRDADLLIKLLRTNRSRFDREDIVTDLWEIGDPSAVEPLIDALQDPDREVSSRAALALADMGGSRAVEPLIELLEKRRLPAAAHALGKLGDLRAIGPLIAALQNDSLSQAAVNALGRIGKGARDALTLALDSAIGKLRERLQEALDKAIETQEGGPLLAALRSDDAATRAQALEEVHARADVKVLRAYIHNPTYYETSDACIRALAQLDGPSAIPDLIERARMSDGTALGELVKLGSVAVEPLIDLAQDKQLDQFMRQSVINYLARMHEPSALEFLIQVLDTERDPITRMNLIDSFGKLGDPRAIAALVKAFLTPGVNGDIDLNAANALEQLGALDKLLEPLIKSLENLDSWTLPSRVDLLAKIGDKRAIEPLRAIMDKAYPNFRESIQEALKKLGYTRTE